MRYISLYNCDESQSGMHTITFRYHVLHFFSWYSLIIQGLSKKISFVCEYCLCSAAVTVVRMGTEFVDSVARHGRNLQTFEQCLRIVQCVYNV